MAQKGIDEFSAKALIDRNWNTYFPHLKNSFLAVLVESGDALKNETASFLFEKPLVVKPDMLFGKRGKNKLVLLNVNRETAAQWIDQKRKGETTLLCGTKGRLTHFLVEPFIPHSEDQEYYLAFSTNPQSDTLYFSKKGGIHIEENWDLVTQIDIPLDANQEEVRKLLHPHAEGFLLDFMVGMYALFKDLHFSYLEFNPFVLEGNKVSLLDTVARLDDTAHYLMNERWGDVHFATPFGTRELTPEEHAVSELDSKSGASLKLTLLNPKGIIWTLVAGGGASVVFADTIANLWGASEIANYGEYSGDPSKEETYFYAKTVLDLMTKEKNPEGRDKILIIGGSIANFTDVAKTFDGIIQAFGDYALKMREVGVQIYVRRGGPNYEIGLKNIENAARSLELPIAVYGPETHLTEIIQISLSHHDSRSLV